MSNPKYSRGVGDFDGPTSPAAETSGAPPTYATFSPTTTLSTSSTNANKISNRTTSSKRRSTILVHQKSPLLLATPPQITRALAYSHPFLLPLNKLAALLSWTTGDAWESFLLLAAFWAVVLYGDAVVRAAAPIVLVLALILGMYGRRFSPLSSSGWSEPSYREGGGGGGGGSNKNKDSSSASASATGNGIAKGGPGKAAGSGGGGGKDVPGHTRADSEITSTRHQKTLDEMVETLKEFTARCNILLDPLLEMTDFLSTQRTPTSATVRPALTTMFIRILFCTPFWVALTLPPLRIITTRRVVLVFGTLVLSWHSRAMRVSRELLWRSSTVRRLAALTTGLTFDSPLRPSTSNLSSMSVATDGSGGPARKLLRKHESELSRALKKQSHHYNHKHHGADKDAGVKFTFIIYENQRRWVGLGWTSNLFAYERAAWTDEHNHAVPDKDAFELPEVEDASRVRWRWAEGSRWKVDGVQDDGKEEVNYDGDEGKNGWVFYDNKWNNGRRGQDGWLRWTRRRKWYRDAELVEIDDYPEIIETQADGDGAIDTEDTPTPTKTPYSTTEEKMISPIRTEHSMTSSTAPITASSSSTTTGRQSEDSAAPGVLSSSVPSTATTFEVGTSTPDDRFDGSSSSHGHHRDTSDTASILSTSSRSFFRTPLLRRRITDRSAVSVAPPPDQAAPGSGSSPAKEALRSVQERSRRASEAKSEEEVAALGATGVEMPEDGKDGWGIGDDARMMME